MILRGENLIKEYGPKKVVKGVSVQVQQGEIVGLLVRTEQEKPHRFI
jgi:lipopolysaccharide export system ATP-binding protein